MSIKKILAPIYRWYKNNKAIIRLYIFAKRKPCKIVVGAGDIYQKGWLPTDIHQLNILKVHDWKKYFELNSIDIILAEHVWEHLTETDGRLAAENCYKFLRVEGYLRLAVPDGYHPDAEYRRYVSPGGTGPGADDHKVLYTVDSLTKLLTSVGYKVRPLEYFDANGKFHYNEWDERDGKIHRSKRFDERNSGGELKYTSVIIDAIKTDSGNIVNQ